MFTFLFNVFYYLISFSLAVFFLFLGILGILLPLSPLIRTDLVQFILENSVAICLFGFGFTVIGLIMIINLYLGTKRTYYYIQTGHRLAAVDEAILQDYLDTYWKQLFPQHAIPSKLTLKKNKIKVIADLPYMPKEDQKQLLERIQQDLQETFYKLLSYTQEFTIAVSFAKK